MGPSIEFGEFHSVRTRPGPRLRGAARKKQRQEKKMCRRTAHSATMTTVAQMTDDTTNNLTPNEQPFFERGIDLAFDGITAECARHHQA